MIDKVFIVFEYDGYDHAGIKGIFAYRHDAEVFQKTLTASDDDMWYSYFIREHEVNYALKKEHVVKKVVDGDIYPL